MNTKTDLRVIRTQKYLRRAYYELWSKYDVQDITVKMLTERAEISRGTFYLYFDSIDSMVSTYRYELFEAFHGNVKRILDMGLDFKDTCAYILRHPFFEEEDKYAFEWIIIGKRADRKLLISAIDSVKDDFLNTFTLDNEADTLQFLIEFVAGGIAATMAQWISIYGSTRPFKELSELMVEIMVNARSRFENIKRR